MAVALDRSFANGVLSTCRAASVTLVDLVPVGVPLALSVLPEEEREARRRAGRSATLRTAKVTACVWTVLVAAGLVVERLDHARVESRLARLQPVSLRVGEARRAMDSAAAMIDTVARAEARRLLLARVLDTLVAGIPDSAVLASVVLGGGGAGEIAGFAQEPLRVLAELQQRRVNAAATGDPAAEPIGGRNWLRFAIRLDTAGP
ncbi:MAG: hypothetical protein ACRENB_16225 [Gemmatimonadales bacterium]